MMGKATKLDGKIEKLAEIIQSMESEFWKDKEL